MTLTTHAVIGAAMASTMPTHPVIGFTLAFASHFLLDAIPHWDYPLNSYKADNENHLNDDMPINKGFFIDLSKIGVDMLCGILLVLIFFGFKDGTISATNITWVPFIGLVGGVLPDALQFVYWKWRHQPLIALQKFHLCIHAKSDFNGKPLIGVPFQMVVILVGVVVAKMIINL